MFGRDDVVDLRHDFLANAVTEREKATKWRQQVQRCLADGRPEDADILRALADVAITRAEQYECRADALTQLLDAHPPADRQE